MAHEEKWKRDSTCVRQSKERSSLWEVREQGWYLKVRPRLDPKDPVTLRHLLRGPESSRLGVTRELERLQTTTARAQHSGCPGGRRSASAWADGRCSRGRLGFCARRHVSERFKSLHDAQCTIS